MRKHKNIIALILMQVFLFYNTCIASFEDSDVSETSTLSPPISIQILDLQEAFSKVFSENYLTIVPKLKAGDITENYKQTITPQFFIDAIREWESSQAKFLNLGPSFFIFGSARFNPGHKWYEEAKKYGRIVAEHFVSIITGGGPGTMQAANEGAYGINKVNSIGLAMQLPHEKKQDSSAFKNIVEIFNYFFIRKLMFIQNSLGGVSVPGGFGTLDEIFDILAFNKRYPDKTRINVLVDEAFYGGLFEFLNNLNQRGLMPHPGKQMLALKNSVEDAFDYLILNTSSLTTKGLDIDLKIPINNLFRASRVLSRLEPAVGIIGGQKIDNSTIYWSMAKRLSGSLSANGVTTIRRGNKGIADAIANAYDELDKTAFLERGLYVALHEEGKELRYNSTDLSLHFDYYFTLKLALTEYSKLGLVVFPGGIDTLDVLCEMLCLIKTNKIDAVPIVLVGREFWRDWINWIEKTMVPAGTINADYLDTIYLVDNEIEAEQIILEHIRQTKIKLENGEIDVQESSFFRNTARGKFYEKKFSKKLDSIIKKKLGKISVTPEINLNLVLLGQAI